MPAWLEGGLAPITVAGFVGGILWLVFVATYGAWGLYYMALHRSSPAHVTVVLYLSPPVVMIWPWVIFGEPLTWGMFFGLLVSIFGIVIIAGSSKAHYPAARD